MKKLFFLCCLLSVFNIYAQKSVEDDKKAILKVLKTQRLAWSDNNLEEFMEGYWKSDSLQFYGSNGLVQGWDNTLTRYQRAYPTADDTGELKYLINTVTKINDGSYYVMGEYHLKRKAGNANGFFMLVFRRMDGKWKIIADTSY
jgi:hypothetical protein